MMRFAWLTMASAVLLTACGGGISSPDFKGDLVGFGIVYPNSTTTNAEARVAPGTSLKFDAIGLYTLPPGTRPTTTTVNCPSVSDTKRVCRKGEFSGVTWSIDPSGTPASGELATITADGLATGKRRGYATVRARATGFPDATQELVVNGPVVEQIDVAVFNAKTNTQFPATPTPSVPVGRSFRLVATALCSTGFAGGRGNDARSSTTSAANCTNTNYQFRFALGDTTDSAAAELNPTSGIGKSVLVKTKQFGPFEIVARFTNEEGLEVSESTALDAGRRVLEDIVVSSDPVQAEPVPIVLGARTRFVAKGLFSTGEVDVISAADLSGGPLVWSEDSSAIGDIEIIESSTPPTSPNTAVLVRGLRIGSTGLTARGNNTESPALLVEDRADLIVRDLGLVKISSVCAATAVDLPCASNVQISVGTTVAFKARGIFEDSPNVERDIDPTQIPIIWSTTAGTGSVNVVDANAGTFSGRTQGTVTITATIADPASESEVMGANRTASAPALVVDPLCIDQLLQSNGTVASSDSTTDDPGPPSEISNTGNVIDNDPATFGTFTVGASLTGGTLTMIFQRVSQVITPPVAGKPLGFLLTYDPDTFDAEGLMNVETINASGQVVETKNFAVSDVERAGVDYKLASTIVTQPFSGVRLNAKVPNITAITPISGGTLDPSLLTTLGALLLGGGSTDVNVYNACGDLRTPSGAPVTP